jgi:regulator of protease activity HflC (stomatin/prohibitin superfamily)
MDTQTIAGLDFPAPQPGSSRDAYRGVVFVLWGGALLGTVVAVVGGVMFSNVVLLDIAVTLGISTGILTGVAMGQIVRARPPKLLEPLKIDEELSTAEPVAETETAALPEEPSRWEITKVSPRLTAVRTWIADWFRYHGALGIIRLGTAIAGVIGIILVLRTTIPETLPTPMFAGISAGACLIAAGLAATAVRYLAELDPSVLPEASGLCRGARVIAWLLILAAISEGLSWTGQQGIVRVLEYFILAVDAGVCYGLLTVGVPRDEPSKVFPLDLGMLSLLGSRTNILASILDTGERQLGIDLRSTWAVEVVRRSIVPIILGLIFVAWLSTMLTVVGVEEQGLVETFGVPAAGQPLGPGLHLHWPWPVDLVYRIPVQRIQALTVGHEGEEEGGPENVLWAVQHAANEFTLVLGNGRDLITIDAAVTYRIIDARAWRYHSQNPADALKAISYRAVMRNTVNRTLSDALSENVVTLTGTMRDMVQKDADAFGLGVKVENFTVGGMHPPVPVATDYEAVVSAQLAKVTAVANAQAFRNQTVPAAQASALASENDARAEGAQNLSVAAGEAWSFRTIESQYRSSPSEYFFRRRLETLENNLGGRHFTIVDSRIQRDGGDLWLTQ